jgi:hypothetical protein
MVGSPQYLDAVADKVSIGVAQGRIAADLRSHGHFNHKESFAADLLQVQRSSIYT